MYGVLLHDMEASAHVSHPVDAGAFLGDDIRNPGVREWVDPNSVESITGIVGRFLCAQYLGKLGKHLVFPADEDVTRPLVLVDNLLDALGVIAAARRIDCQAEILGYRLNRIVRSFSLAVWLVRLSHDMADVVVGAASKDTSQALRALFALRTQACLVAVVGFLAVADEEDDGLCRNEAGRPQGSKIRKLHRMLESCQPKMRMQMQMQMQMQM